MSADRLARLLKRHLAGRDRAALLLDFDGTLAPIVRRPHLARLSSGLKRKLTDLQADRRWTLGVVSGRDLPTVKKKVGIPGLIYAGNHGFEILLPGRPLVVHPAARRARPTIALICRTMRARLRGIPGALVENKIYSASLHTRTLSAGNERRAAAIAHDVLAPYVRERRIRVTEGKKVVEIRPPAKWNKGEAVKYVLKNVPAAGYPVYVGDDRTDEDAFAALKSRGLGIRVGRGGRTMAAVSIANVTAMAGLIDRLRTALNGRRAD